MNERFLELLNPQLDSDQLKCCTVRNNAVIKAGAGSGKTEVFSNRFSWLIMRDEKPLSIDKILTLTFTEKAASEMYQRIYKTLKLYAAAENPELITPDQKKRAEIALMNFSSAHIQTLDSFCSEIVRRHSGKLGVPQNFTVTSKESKNQFREDVLHFILRNRNNPSIQHYVEPGKFEQFSKDVASMFEKYTSIVTPDNFFTDSLQEQEKEIKQTAFQIAKALSDCCQDKNPEEKEFWQELDDISCMDAKGSRKEQIETVRNLICFEGKNKPNLATAAITFYETKSIIKELFTLFDDFLKQVNENKRISGALSFKDINDLALHILKTDVDVQKKESLCFDQIMIDEFQDNNKDNRDLLLLLCNVPPQLLSSDYPENRETGIREFLCLNSPEKLYFVGDEKQSIYRFRGADVSVFQSLRNVLSPETGDLYMNYNYRSNPPLVSSFNKIFGKLEYNGEIITDPTLPHLLRTFTEKEFIKKNINDSRVSKYINNNKNVWNPDTESVMIKQGEHRLEVCLLCEKEMDGFPKANDQLFFFTAKKIRELKSQGIPYKDMAILDKSRSQRNLLCRYLTLFGIPFILDEEKELFNDGPANDIYSVLKLLDDKENINAMGTFLCSPFMKMSFNAAIESLYQYSQGNEDKNIAVAHEIIEKIKARADGKIADLLAFIWYETGYCFNVILQTKTKSYEKQFDIMYELARKADEEGKNLKWFINQLERRRNKELDIRAKANEDNSELDVESIICPTEQRDAVKIMTIHKSKGLQFPYVFTFGCMDKLKSESCPPFFFDKKTGISIKPITGQSFSFILNKEKSTEEAKAEYERLTYVAFTRASEKLFALGSYKPAKQEDMPAFNRFVHYFHPLETNDNLQDECKSDAPFLFTDIEKVSKTTMDRVISESLSEESEPEVKFVRAFEGTTKNTISPSTMEILHEETKPTVEDKPEVLGELDAIINTNRKYGFGNNDFGTIAHKVMENLISKTDNSSFDWDDLKLNINSNDMNKLVEIAVSMSESFIAGEIYDEIKNSDFVKTEWAFKAFRNNFFVNGSIDLVFKTQEGQYKIVDYKTDREINPEKYYEQQELYRIFAADLLKTEKKNISCYLFYLRHGRLIDITKECNSTDITEDTFRQAREKAVTNGR